jgi:hypothetical protein
LFAAIASLAQNVEALAGSVREANGNLRQRLALDAPDPELPALEHSAAESSGTAATGQRRARRQTA